MGFKTSRRKSDSLKLFQEKCLIYKKSHPQRLDKIRAECLKWIQAGYVLRVDTYFAFEHSRLWTEKMRPQQLDADNRRKPMQDEVGKLLEIDDKYFFSGFIEKVSCINKDFECSIVKISPVLARGLGQIVEMMNQEGSIQPTSSKDGQS